MAGEDGQKDVINVIYFSFGGKKNDSLGLISVLQSDMRHNSYTELGKKEITSNNSNSM